MDIQCRENEKEEWHNSDKMRLSSKKVDSSRYFLKNIMNNNCSNEYAGTGHTNNHHNAKNISAIDGEDSKDHKTTKLSMEPSYLANSPYNHKLFMYSGYVHCKGERIACRCRRCLVKTYMRFEKCGPNFGCDDNCANCRYIKEYKVMQHEEPRFDIPIRFKNFPILKLWEMNYEWQGKDFKDEPELVIYFISSLLGELPSDVEAEIDAIDLIVPHDNKRNPLKELIIFFKTIKYPVQIQIVWDTNKKDTGRNSEKFLALLHEFGTEIDYGNTGVVQAEKNLDPTTSKGQDKSVQTIEVSNYGQEDESNNHEDLEIEIIPVDPVNLATKSQNDNGMKISSKSRVTGEQKNRNTSKMVYVRSHFRHTPKGKKIKPTREDRKSGKFLKKWLCENESDIRNDIGI